MESAGPENPKPGPRPETTAAHTVGHGRQGPAGDGAPGACQLPGGGVAEEGEPKAGPASRALGVCHLPSEKGPGAHSFVLTAVVWSLSPDRLSAIPRTVAPSGSSVHGILQPRTLEWVAMPSSRASSPPRNRARISCIAGGFFTTEPPGKPQVQHALLLSLRCERALFVWKEAEKAHKEHTGSGSLGVQPVALK